MHQHKHLKEAIAKLKQVGIRITPQRHAVLDYLIEAKSHPTADEIYKSLEGTFPNMSVATVYNNLRVLKEAGLVKELTYGDASSRFDFVTDDHYHVICVDCGKIVDFECDGLDEIEELAQHKTGFEITHHRMEIYGVCPVCKEKEEVVG
jgi:Fur family transcriptional regulator, peroxide stress response regulator